MVGKWVGDGSPFLIYKIVCHTIYEDVLYIAVIGAAIYAPRKSFIIIFHFW